MLSRKRVAKADCEYDAAFRALLDDEYVFTGRARIVPSPCVNTFKTPASRHDVELATQSARLENRGLTGGQKLG